MEPARAYSPFVYESSYEEYNRLSSKRLVDLESSRHAEAGSPRSPQLSYADSQSAVGTEFIFRPTAHVAAPGARSSGFSPERVSVRSLVDPQFGSGSLHRSAFSALAPRSDSPSSFLSRLESESLKVRADKFKALAHRGRSAAVSDPRRSFSSVRAASGSLQGSPPRVSRSLPSAGAFSVPGLAASRHASPPPRRPLGFESPASLRSSSRIAEAASWVESGTAAAASSPRRSLSPDKASKAGFRSHRAGAAGAPAAEFSAGVSRRRGGAGDGGSGRGSGRGGSRAREAQRAPRETVQEALLKTYRVETGVAGAGVAVAVVVSAGAIVGALGAFLASPLGIALIGAGAG